MTAYGRAFSLLVTNTHCPPFGIASIQTALNELREASWTIVWL